jgi:hypothetical protein
MGVANAKNFELCRRPDTGGRRLRLLQVASASSGKRGSGERVRTTGFPKECTREERLANGRAAVPIGTIRSRRKTLHRTSVTRMTRRLEKVRDAWDVFQASRARDAVYGYLDAVFAIVTRYKVRGRATRLLRRAFEFAKLPFDKNADPFTVIIRCTSSGDSDNKTISKWARALRYVARYKAPSTQLKMFMKQAGGVNACAEMYASYLRRGAK